MRVLFGRCKWVMAGVVVAFGMAQVVPVEAAPVERDLGVEASERQREYLIETYGVTEAQAATAVGVQSQSIDLVDDLDERLGGRLLSSRIETSTGELHVVVADEQSAVEARAAGAHVTVGESYDWDAAKAEVGNVLDSVGIDNFSLSVNSEYTGLVVTIGGLESSPASQQAVEALSGLDFSVVVEFSEKTSERAHIAGDSIAICTLGFNVRQDSTGNTYATTAGHCSESVGQVIRDSTGGRIGEVTEFNLGPSDYALIKPDNGVVLDGEIGMYISLISGSVDVEKSTTPVVGASVCHTGQTSGTRCGKITDINITVNAEGITTKGQIKADICTEPGDSGGPLFLQNGLDFDSPGFDAIGLISAGNGFCDGDASNSNTIYQPIGTIEDLGYSIY